MVPGSLSGTATEVFQEGVRIPGIRIVRRGEAIEEATDLLFANVRQPDERRGDLQAMIGACRIAERRLAGMLERWGVATAREAMTALLDRAEARMREAIRRVPDGVHEYETYLDNTGGEPEPLLLKLRLAVEGDSLDADFSGCAAQVAGPTNLGPATSTTAVFTMSKALLDPKSPINAGAMRPLSVTAPLGTVVNARPPAACGAIGEVRRALESLVVGTLGKAIPDCLVGDLKGASNITAIGGPHPGRDRDFLHVEFPAGGTGAFAGADGNNTMRNFAEGDISSIQPVESIEATCPLRIESTTLRQDSGGAGYRRGGLGLRREVRLLGPHARLSVLSDKNVIPPYGVRGGCSSAPNRFTVRRDGQEIAPSALPGKVTAFGLLANDVVIEESAGGGGYGDPLERDPASVSRDVAYGYVSPGAALRELWGCRARHRGRRRGDGGGAREAGRRAHPPPRACRIAGPRVRRRTRRVVAIEFGERARDGCGERRHWSSSRILDGPSLRAWLRLDDGLPEREASSSARRRSRCSGSPSATRRRSDASMRRTGEMEAARGEVSRPVVGVDVGGTFTDLVLFDPDRGALEVCKVPSTSADQSLGVVDGLGRMLPDLSELDRLIHGTTVATNTLLEGDGARVAMITTAGFRDVLEIGRTRRMLPSVYDTTFERPPPLVPRPLRFEVGERVDHDGAILAPLEASEIEAVARRLRGADVDALAICFLHAYANPEHEHRALDAVRRVAPGIAPTASHQVVPEFREYERFSTTVINAFLLPVMSRYLSTLGAALAGRRYRGAVYTMASNGGTMDLATVQTLPIRTILSGPVGGVTGALRVAEIEEITHFVTCDMGGTSTDVCLVEHGSPKSVNETAFVGYPIKGRQIDINTVGAGGGSIAWADGADTLRVGPRSAGAAPGPACYGLGGTEPTITDANMVLGRIGTRRLGGAIEPDPGLALDAVEGLAERLGVEGVVRMADGIVRVAVAQMASAIREVTIERGYDPADFSLVAFGGAGPMHATVLAEDIGMSEVLIPQIPRQPVRAGAACIRIRSTKWCGRSSAVSTRSTLRALAGVREAHAADGRADLARRGFDRGAMRLAHALDMRYAHQAFEITVDMADDAEWSAETLRDAFLTTYRRHYGHADPDGDIEVVNVRTSVIGVTRKPSVPRLDPGTGTIEGAVTARRDAWFDESRVNVAIYERRRLPVDVSFEGPAIVEEDGATTVITPGWVARADRSGNLRLVSTGRG